MKNILAKKYQGVLKNFTLTLEPLQMLQKR
jgi:hypothetical protein